MDRLPRSEVGGGGASVTAEDVLGGGTGGWVSLREDCINLAWLVVEQEERVEEDPSWVAPPTPPRLSSSQERVPVRRGGSSSPSLRTPELHSSRTLSDSLCPARSASSSTIEM